MFNKSDSNINLWLLILILSHIIQDKYSIFNLKVRFPTKLSLRSLVLTKYIWQSSIETVTAPPFYKQIAGTVVLCDVSISVTSSYSAVSDLDLSCKTLYDESLPPATPEQLGELSESLQFFTKIGKGLQSAVLWSIIISNIQAARWWSLISTWHLSRKTQRWRVTLSRSRRLSRRLRWSISSSQRLLHPAPHL